MGCAIPENHRRHVAEWGAREVEEATRHVRGLSCHCNERCQYQVSRSLESCWSG